MAKLGKRRVSPHQNYTAVLSLLGDAFYSSAAKDSSTRRQQVCPYCKSPHTTGKAYCSAMCCKQAKLGVPFTPQETDDGSQKYDHSPTDIPPDLSGQQVPQAPGGGAGTATGT